MKTMNKLIMMFLCLLLPLGAGAQDTYWTVDPYAYQYDMTAYVALSLNGDVVSNLSGFEIAAFCGGECRGVATIQTAGEGSDAATYGYLRIRSNQEEGETITFKIYHSKTDTEIIVNDVTVDFKSMEVVGLPSSPMVIAVTQIIPGDVNNDGQINAADLSAVINKILKRPNVTFNEAAADMNGDGVINAADLSAIINIILKK